MDLVWRPPHQIARLGLAEPLVRFGTGDLSARTLGADGSLRPTAVHGRAGETRKVCVAFLHPRQAAALVREPDVTAHRFVIDRTDHKDNLRCEVVTALTSDPHLSQRVPELIRAHLRLSAEVVCVPTLSDGPTIDDQATGPNPARRPPCGNRSPRRNG